MVYAICIKIGYLTQLIKLVRYLLSNFYLLKNYLCFHKVRKYINNGNFLVIFNNLNKINRLVKYIDL